VRLVDERRRDLLQLVAVLTGVVRAEQELAPGLELDAEIGLGSTTVATVRCGQPTRLGAECNCSGHDGLISLLGVVGAT
jgi:hypothetical protein